MDGYLPSVGGLPANARMVTRQPMDCHHNWPCLALFDTIWPRFPMFVPGFARVGPVLAPFAPFGPVWPRLAPFGPIWPYLASFGPIRPCLAPLPLEMWPSLAYLILPATHYIINERPLKLLRMIHIWCLRLSSHIVEQLNLHIKYRTTFKMRELSLFEVLESNNLLHFICKYKLD